MSENKSEKEIRLEKLTELKRLGINPYPNTTPAHITISEARAKKDGAKLATVGRIAAIREHGQSTFVDLVDDDQKLQVYFKQDEVGQTAYDLLKLLDTGDYIWATGELFTTKAGELSLKAKEFQLLAKSLLPIPDSWHGLTDVEARYRQRALDFKINPEARKIIATRAKVIQIIRDYFIRNGFLEVQTPILQPIPGGATAKPFITHYNTLDADFYLRIAPELYLKRLIAGGFNKVFEIGPSFRNEGLSHMHNPEFYSVEAYWAYQDYMGFLKATQELIQELVKNIHGSLKISYQGQEIDFSGDIPIKKYADIIKADSDIDITKADTFAKLSEVVHAKEIKFTDQKITVWSELVDELFKKVSRPKIIQPIFVIDYPIALQPLAKKGRDDETIVEQFQLIAGGGFELLKAYSELNDPLDQEARFRDQAKMKQAGWDEAMSLDENFIEALKFGMPPTSGWGMGIERLVMLLTDQHSIKEVIPFPTLRPIKWIMSEVTKFKKLSQFPGLLHGIATTEFGNMSFRWDESSQVRSNRATFFDQLDVPEKNVVVASLLHGHTIHAVGEAEHGRGVNSAEDSLEGDILVTNTADTYLFLVVADCLAIFFYDPKHKVVALAHAGWRGVDQEVPRLTVDHLVKKYGSDPAKIVVGLSPALQVRSSIFNNPDDLDVSDRDKWQPYISEIDGHLCVDWIRFAFDQLIGTGVLKTNIENSGIDTLTNEDYFSHRRSAQQKQPEGRFGCLIGLSKNN